MRSTLEVPGFDETSTSPPLGGTGERFHGRSSDSAIFKFTYRTY